ncbi:MAG: UvrD-helicase domain-containing protein [Deltaproteobacteria bacterium]|nr:UvrD-helicase domain-containing protein [Deltaproteobacteria bacterium]MBW1927923.1 UvrD-helicase domain-containing protein [Deltaproteobacteria bacterium]MBW2024836.1 UvrD-helicase domain-containing protein [Deltaproteobacteria bacterium]MBW2124786.1 UvrD-helicase domain-containing protein [Deltaproteobacteria bacterium]RLB24331.1 MAG: ATP-dependent helicase [Deltaproteobacteria bacterium]
MANTINYKKVLNPAQLEAVMTLEGPVLVIAGAGSGKTRTLVYRVARLVETGVDPESILLLTFTRKAAQEMLDRAASLSDPRCRLVSGGTFHSLAHRVLRKYPDLVGFERTFTILDRSDMEEILQSLVKELKTSNSCTRVPKRGTLANILSKAANLEIPIEELITREYPQFMDFTPMAVNLYKIYSRYKKQNQLMDYDDLILNLRMLLATNKVLRDQLSEQYRYIMVDEYQDTNKIQADIVRWLAHQHHNVMVVGDDSQSIYSFRGANYRNMFDFPNLFPGTKVIKLEENYRSTQPILTFTNALMDRAEQRYTKCLFTRREGGALPRLVNTRTEPEQALFVCREIKERLSRGFGLKDIAVLFRAAYHSFELELELARQSIRYIKVGGFKFMESAHIKDLLAHFRVILNPDDLVSWGRILRLVHNIGQAKSESIIRWMKEKSVAPGAIGQWPGAGRAEQGLKALSELLSVLDKGNCAPKTAVEKTLEYYRPVLEERYDDYPKRERELEQLILMASRYKSLGSFLDDLVLEPPTSVADMDPGARGEALTLSTVHSAKGLEWPVVFIIWVMDGRFPSSKAYGDPLALEEERRLMYVAATRAKDELILCYPAQEAAPSWQLGWAGSQGGLSCFIRDLPFSVLAHEVSGMPQRQQANSVDDIPGDSEFSPGDRVNHPAFGAGVISRLVGQDKVEVLFRNVGRKLLHLAYTTLDKV